jgi:protein SCO1/2
VKPEARSTNTQTFQVKGTIKGLKSDGKTVEIRHEPVTNYGPPVSIYMPGMTMPFEAKHPNELAGLKPGDAVAFRLSVTDDDSWIDQIRKIETNQPVSLADLPPTNGYHFLQDVDPLQIGDLLPEYNFTNHLGQPFSTEQFKGQAVAITFIFTRCPLPNFCPRMSSNFEEVQKQLLSAHPAFTNWRLVTISFDPDFDTPVILKAYAERFHADPAHWSFVTGKSSDIAAIAGQFGETFWKDETGMINHNLRTVVLDTAGRVKNIYTGNAWKPEELIQDLTAAAKDAR